jgi:hypothetical protein
MTTAIVGQAFRKVRATMNGAGRKFEGALVELRRLIALQRKTETFHADVTKLLVSYQEREQEAAVAFRAALQSGDVDQVRTSLEKWVESKSFVETTQSELQHLTSSRAQGLPSAVLLDQNRTTVKPALLTVAQGRLSAAKTDAERIAKDETKRLGTEWGPDDVATSPVVRRAASRVRQLELAVRRIQSEEITATWPIFSQQLLEG